MTRRFAVLSSLLLAACGGATAKDPKSVLQSFLTAVEKADGPGARRLLVTAEQHDESLSFEREGLQDGYRLGAARVTGDRAQVPMTVQRNGKEMTLPMVLHKQDDGWRLCLHDTMQAALDEMRQRAGQPPR